MKYLGEIYEILLFQEKEMIYAIKKEDAINAFEKVEPIPRFDQ